MNEDHPEHGSPSGSATPAKNAADRFDSYEVSNEEKIKSVSLCLFLPWQGRGWLPLLRVVLFLVKELCLSIFLLIATDYRPGQVQDKASQDGNRRDIIQRHDPRRA
jgi:hypothetical protein